MGRRPDNNQEPLRPERLELLGVGPSPVPPPLVARVREALAGEIGPAASLRALTTSLRVGAGVVVIALLSLVVLAVTPRHDLAAYPSLRMALALGIFAALGLMAVWTTLRPLHQPEVSTRGHLGLSFAVLASIVAMALLPDAYSGAGLHVHVSAPVLDAAWRCLVFGVVTGAPFVLAARILDRAGLKGRTHLHFAGATAALTGNLTLQLHCPLTDPLHLLLGHATVVLPFLALEALVRKKM